MQKIKGRGSSKNPPNRFDKFYIEPLPPDEIGYNEEQEDEKLQTEFYIDHSKNALSKNESDDLPFTYSLNPYKGCEHGCIYCYARQTHEYLGFSSGLDFETKIFVKKDAPQLLEKTFLSPSWKPQVIVFSGNTDCYQPVERKLKLTRQCLEVCLKYRNPVSMITKNGLILRDLDLISEMAKLNLINVTLSITTLKQDLVRIMEPRTASPLRRLQVIETFAKNNINTGVNIAPLIPGLNEEEIPLILKEAADRGAKYAHYILLRLPYAVKDIFIDWIEKNMPDRAPKIINRIKEIRGGKLNESEFFKRYEGHGESFNVIKKMFYLYCSKYNLNKRNFEFDTSLFTQNTTQFELF